MTLNMKESISIHAKEDIEEAVRRLGFLPFFTNEIEGFSIEENTDPSIWFTDQPGPWEWKGPVIQDGGCVYGKFFHGRAGFISIKWFYDFANYRRDGYDFDARVDEGIAPDKEQYLYKIIASHHSILSRAAKVEGGYLKPKGKNQNQWEPRKGFDSTITKLQMECYVVISDFEYDMDKHGNFYGWGVARYATAENFLGKKFKEKVYQRTPEESYERIVRHIKKITGADRDLVEYFLKK